MSTIRLLVAIAVAVATLAGCAEDDPLHVRNEGDADSDTDSDTDTDTDTAPLCEAGGVYDGSFVIGSAADLARLSGCSAITGNLEIRDTWLTSLLGLESLREVSGDLKISGGESLTSLTGLDRLEHVGGSLQLAENHEFLDVNGLERLTAIDGSLAIFGNPKLASLDGLAGLTSLRCMKRADGIPVSGLAIAANPLLPTCEAWRLLERLAARGFNGEVFIDGNDDTAPCHCPEQILEGDHAIQDLADLEALDTYTRITGSLTISGTSLIQTAGATCLRTIDGDLVITDNDSLERFGGLLSLSEIGGDLRLSSNPALSEFPGLDRLTTVGGDIEVQGNTALNRLTNLRNLTSLGGALAVSSSPGLESLTALEGLTTLGGGLTLSSNPALASLEGLHNLTAIGGDLRLDDCDRLRYPAHLHNLTAIDGSLVVEGNERMTMLAGLKGLTRLGGDLRIQDNPTLPTCEAERLQSDLAEQGWSGTATIAGNDDSGICGDCGGGMLFGDQRISEAAELEALAGVEVIVGKLDIGSEHGGTTDIADLSALSCLAVVDGRLTIDTFDSPLTSLTGLDSLTVVGESLLLHDNLNLESVAGLGSLNEVGGTLSIDTQPWLTDLDGLEQLQSVGGGLEVVANDRLENLDGLGGLTALGGRFLFSYNASLPTCEAELLLQRLRDLGYQGDARIERNDDTAPCDCPEQILQGDYTIGSSSDLDGLFGVTTLNGALSVIQSDLTEFDGLGCLRAVAGDLVIDGNSTLKSLDGLGGLQSLGGDLFVTDNVALSTCLVERFRDRLAAGGWSGSATIAGNNDDAPCDCPNGTWEGGFDFTSEAELRALSGYTRITGNLHASRGVGLVNLTGLECLQVIDGSLGFGVMFTLETLEGLQNLREIGAGLHIGECSVLETLDGLRGLEVLGGDLSIVMNPILPTCEAEVLRDRLQAGGWRGSADIRGNDDSGTCE